MVLKDSLNLPHVVQKGCESGWGPSLGGGIPHPREPGFLHSLIVWSLEWFGRTLSMVESQMSVTAENLCIILRK